MFEDNVPFHHDSKNILAKMNKIFSNIYSINKLTREQSLYGPEEKDSQAEPPSLWSVKRHGLCAALSESSHFHSIKKRFLITAWQCV